MLKRRNWMLLMLVLAMASVTGSAQEAEAPAAPAAPEAAAPAAPVEELRAAPTVPVDAPQAQPGTGDEITLNETTDEEVSPPATQPYLIYIMLGGFILLWIWMGRGRKKQEQKRKEMLSKLSKGDKVTSIGGIIGTILEVRDDEITVKVDENNNVRMKFARWAIRGVGDAAKTEEPENK